ncbi:MAG: tetratricopeptide repeat protein [Alistipes sp.]|nr:tetratricopeptide repeat protein [Alistipes sp.]
MKRYIITLLSLFCSLCVMAQGAEQAGANADAEAATENSSVEENIPTDMSAEELWSSANEAYNNAEYATALERYNAILDRGLHSAALYYNLANTHFKTEQLGKAILYYNRALRLSPADEDIRHNLEYAEQMTKDSIEEIPEFILTTWVRAVRGALSSTAWTVISLILLVAALIMALFYLLAQRLALRKMGFYTMVIAALLFILTSLFAWSEREMIVNSKEAIIMTSAVSIKSSPDRAATELFVLHEGTKVSIGHEIAGWAEVRISDGRKGWIEQSRIEKI